MLALRSDIESSKEPSCDTLDLSFHPSFYPVYEKLKKWCTRFPFTVDYLIFNDLTLLYLLATKKYLDHRTPSHLFRLALTLHLIQKKLLRLSTFSPQSRHLEIRWIPTELVFPFSHKPVLGCLIGFNFLDRYEVFDEENIVLALQKHLPQLRLVKESSYCHTSQHKNLKILYFEIEKRDGSLFSLLEQSLLKNNLEEKVKASIQPLSPTIYMGHNDEEIYKHVLVLSQEIQSLQDLPQAYITLDQQTGKEIIFRVILVHISPFHRFSLKDRFSDHTFMSQRVLKVRHLDNHPIEAHIFRLHLPRDPSLLRSDGSLDFYPARQKVAGLIKGAIGEFRDYNGGIIIKQQELFHSFKESFPEIVHHNPELLEAFFYSITPLEKQVILQQYILANLFTYFLENRKQKLPEDMTYSFKTYHTEQQIFLVIYSNHSSLTEMISTVLQDQPDKAQNLAYNFIDSAEGVYFNCVLLQADIATAKPFIQSLQQALEKWQTKLSQRQILKIASEYSAVSLDPRIGGESVSGDILRLLFEGLTRFNSNGQIENAVAESISISSNLKQYIFKLRACSWNDGSPISAYDFEYAWKKILSPNFKTAFAYFFYPIKNAKEAKEGKVPPEQIGIEVLDDRTLKVELLHPTSYFLQSTAHPLYSPIHRVIDQQHPQWPYQSEKNYPCNGPFQLKINQPNQGYQLVKNSFYRDASHIMLDEIILKLMNPPQALQAFHKKEIDWIGNPLGAADSFNQVGKEGRVISFPNFSVCWCSFNIASHPYNHRKLRQAFAYAIQRAQIVTESDLPLNPAYSILLPHYHQNCSPLFPKYDANKARQLLNEGLEELGLCKKDLPPLNFIFHEKGIHSYTAHALKKQLKECLDIDCELKPLPWNILFKRLINADFHIALNNWYSWVNDPIYTLNAFKFAKQELNFTRWEHPEFQQLLDLSEQEINPFQRSSFLLKAEEILNHEMPAIPLFYQPAQALVHKDLNVNFNSPCGPFNIARSFYNKKEK